MKRTACIFFAFLLLSCSAAFADYYKYVGADSSTVYGGWAISYYHMELSTSPSGPWSSPVNLTCITIDKTIDSSHVYEYTLLLHQIDPLYKGASWLMNVAPIGNKEVAQWAVWWLLSSEAIAEAHGLPSTGTFHDLVYNWVKEAMLPANYEQIAWVNVYKAATTGDYAGGQDFIDGHELVPEPASMLLFGTALLGTGLAARRRRKQS